MSDGAPQVPSLGPAGVDGSSPCREPGRLGGTVTRKSQCAAPDCCGNVQPQVYFFFVKTVPDRLGGARGVAPGGARGVGGLGIAWGNVRHPALEFLLSTPPLPPHSNNLHTKPQG